MNKVALALIPVFVAVDAIGTLQVYISLTRDLEKRKRTAIAGIIVASAG